MESVGFLVRQLIYELQLKKSEGFPTRFDTSRPQQPQEMARSLTFQILEEEGMYYICSKNKVADQLCSY